MAHLAKTAAGMKSELAKNCPLLKKKKKDTGLEWLGKEGENGKREKKNLLEKIKKVMKIKKQSDEERLEYSKNGRK